MRQWISKLLTVSTKDEEVAQRGRFFIALCSALMMLSLMSLSSLILFTPADQRAYTLTMIMGLAALYGVGIVLTRTGRLDAGGLIVSGGLMLNLTLGAIILNDNNILWFNTLALLLGSFVLRPGLIWLLFGIQLTGLGLVAINNSDDQNVQLVLFMVGLFSLSVTVICYTFQLFNLRFVRRIFQTTEDLKTSQRQTELARERAEDAAQEALAARAKAEEASLAKSRFLATMSHELRTPLNAIIGYAEIIEEELGDEAEAVEHLRADAESIHSAGRHLLRLISDILDLSKIEAGHMSVHVEPFELSELIRELTQTMAPQLKKNGNTLDVEINLINGSMIQDRIKLHQILLNLLSNANKFTEEGQITLRISERGKMLTFEVEDTGIGINEQALSQLFEPFVQADSSTTRRYGGTGLGLALCRQLAQMLDGEVSCTSVLGQGSCFTLKLPRKDNSAEFSTLELRRVNFSRRALLVGPDKHLNELRAKALAREGWACATSHEAKEATHYAKTFNPHAMIVELRADAQLDIPWLEALARLKMTPEPVRVALMPRPDWPRGQSLGYYCLEPNSSAQQIVDRLKAEQALTPLA